MWLNKDERSLELILEVILVIYSFFSFLSYFGMVLFVGLGYKVFFWIFFKLILENCI